MTILTVSMPQPSPDSTHKVYYQFTTEAVLRFYCHMHLKQNVDISWKFQKCIYKLSLVHRFFSNQGNILVFVLVFSNSAVKKSYCNTLFSKAGIDDNLHLGVFVVITPPPPKKKSLCNTCKGLLYATGKDY